MKKAPRVKRETVFLKDELSLYMGSLSKPRLNLLTCWHNVAAPHVLEHTDNVVYEKSSQKKAKRLSPERVDIKQKEQDEQNNVVLVFVDSSVYAAELSMDKELYRIRMQQETKKEISDIKFLVSRKTSLRKRK